MLADHQNLGDSTQGKQTLPVLGRTRQARPEGAANPYSKGSAADAIVRHLRAGSKPSD